MSKYVEPVRIVSHGLPMEGCTECGVDGERRLGVSGLC